MSDAFPVIAFGSLDDARRALSRWLDRAAAAPRSVAIFFSAMSEAVAPKPPLVPKPGDQFVGVDAAGRRLVLGVTSLHVGDGVPDETCGCDACNFNREQQAREGL